MKTGFTLIELLVVVLIISILAAVALPQYQTAVERSRATEALTMMGAIRASMERYHAQHEYWPSNNAFNKLDVEIPVTSGTSHGGKFFTITFGSDVATSPTASIYAVRSGSHPYKLSTIITANADGTYSATRSCGAVSGGPLDSDATDYCNAISGGTPSSF